MPTEKGSSIVSRLTSPNGLMFLEITPVPSQWHCPHYVFVSFIGPSLYTNPSSKCQLASSKNAYLFLRPKHCHEFLNRCTGLIVLLGTW